MIAAGQRTKMAAAVGLAGLLAVPALADAPPLTFEALWQSASPRAPALQIAQSAADAARAQVAVARLPWLPNAWAEASLTETTANFVPKPGVLPKTVLAHAAPHSWELFPFWRSELAAQWTVTDFGKTAAAVDAAERTAEQWRHAAQSARRLLWAQAAAAWFACVAADETLAVATRQREVAQKRLDAVAARVAARVRPLSDQTRAQSQLATGDLQLAQARQSVAEQRQMLAAILALPAPPEGPLDPSALPLPADATAALHSPDALQQACDRAAADRPELAALQAQRLSLQAQIAAVQRSQNPTLFLAAGGSAQGMEISGLVVNAQAGAGINWGAGALWQAGAYAAVLREQLRGVAAAEALVRSQVRAELQAAALAVVQAEARLPVHEAAVRAAQAAVDQSQARYDAGVAVLVEVMDAAAQLARLQHEWVVLRAQQRNATAQWLAAIGKISP